MKIKTLILFLALGLVWGPSPARADHIPETILKEIWREANVPYCHYENRVNGTGYDCADEDPDWISCWTTFLAEDLSYQGALDLLGQLKVSNSYIDHWDLRAENPYIGDENLDILMEIDFVCWF